MKAYKEQANVGRKHIGFTANPAKLNSELIGVLNLPETVVGANGQSKSRIQSGS